VIVKPLNLITPLLALGVASMAIVGLTYNFETSNSLHKLTEFRQKVLDESMIAAASREAMLKRISQLPVSYLPAANYFDPCDTYATRKECCTDPSYPVLGGLDVVNYRLTGQIIFGDPKIEAEIQGISRTYKFWFADKTSVSIFEASPEVYLPLWGGFDATEFCTSGESDVQTLIASTVDLSKSFEIDRHISFAALTADESKSCGRSFNNLYGIPVNGIFNTRCVSMSNFQNPTVGLVLDMPSSAVPVKMSELYGVPPGVPIGARTKEVELLSADNTNPDTVDQLIDAAYSAVQTRESQTNEMHQQVEFPSELAPSEAEDVQNVDALYAFLQPQPSKQDRPYPDTNPSSSLNVNAASENKNKPAKTFEEINRPAPLTAAMPQAAPPNELGVNALTIEQSFPNSEKPLGEKAMLKRGLVDPSQVRESTINQLYQAGDEGIP